MRAWPSLAQGRRGRASSVSADSSTLLAGCRPDWSEMVSLASLLKMACGTFMVIALTMRLGTPILGFALLSVCSYRQIQFLSTSVCRLRRVLVIIYNEAVV